MAKIRGLVGQGAAVLTTIGRNLPNVTRQPDVSDDEIRSRYGLRCVRVGEAKSPRSRTAVKRQERHAQEVHERGITGSQSKVTLQSTQLVWSSEGDDEHVIRAQSNAECGGHCRR